ncbi:MAG: hypothetical protein WC464_05785 [Bdellovibrionales bacterium]
MIEIGAVASEYTNLTVRNIEDVTKNGGSDVAEVAMSFDDFLDMINPLEHIPGISSIWRAIVGEDIHPVSRIVGDTLYGGVMGVASAGLSALGAIGDEAVAAANGGDTISKTVVAALFGNEEKQNIQIADASLNIEKAKDAAPQIENTQATTAIPLTAQQTLASSLTKTETPSLEKVALARTKLPFGGVMDSTPHMQDAKSLSAVMGGQREILQAQRNLRNSRFAVTVPANATTIKTAATETAAATTTISATSEPETQDAMQKLLQELQAMKAINQYQNAAQSAPLLGESVNVVN